MLVLKKSLTTELPTLTLPPLPGEREEVKNPGSKGGTGYRDERGKWHYGKRPTEKVAAAPAKPFPALSQTTPNPVPLSPPVYERNVQYAIDALAINTRLNPLADTLPTTPELWAETICNRLGITSPAARDSRAQTLVFPDKVSQWVTDGGAGIKSMLDSMDPKVLAEAVSGLGQVERNRRLLEHHALTPYSVMMHFIWASFARGTAPFEQESAFLDLEHDEKFGHFVDACLNGTFDKTEFDTWLHDNENQIMPDYAAKRGWLTRPERPDSEKYYKGLTVGSPGHGVLHEVIDIGDMFASWNGRLQPFMDAVLDPKVSGRECRRLYWRNGLQKGSSINNKILSFALAMIGKTDLAVLDRWQARNFHPAASAAAEEKYGNLEQSSTSILKQYNIGPPGLAATETLEDMLAKAAKDGLAGDKRLGTVPPSPFALHWISWVNTQSAAPDKGETETSGALVGHHSLDTTVALTEQGLTTRAQQRAPGETIPTATERLARHGRGGVAHGTQTQHGKTMRAYGSFYERGRVDPGKLEQLAYRVPTEFIEGGTNDPFGAWLKQQPAQLRAAYSEQADRALEPLMRRLATTLGLAISVTEGYGGYGGTGNVNSHAILVPLRNPPTAPHKRLEFERDTERAVKAFAASMAYALRQDGAMYGRVAASYTDPGVHVAYDFPLQRSLDALEAERLGMAVTAHMRQAATTSNRKEFADMDAGFTQLPNNHIRFVNDTATFSDEEFEQVVRAAVKEVAGDFVDKEADGEPIRYAVPWQGGYIGNDWHFDPEGHGYDAARQYTPSVHPGATSPHATEGLVRDLHYAFRAFNAQFAAQHPDPAAAPTVNKSVPSPLLPVVRFAKRIRGLPL